MSVSVRSSTSSNEWIVDKTSNAARVSLYASDGTDINAPPTASYFGRVEVRTNAIAANNTIWAMRNGAVKTVYVRSIFINMQFDGTAGGAPNIGRFAVQRFSAATPTGGLRTSPMKKRSYMPASMIQDIRSAVGGLSTTGVTFESDAVIFAVPMVVTGGTSNCQVFFNMPNETYDTFVLASNEGLAIRTSTVSSIAGMGAYGYVEWDER